MLPVLIDALLLVLRTFVAVNLNRLKIRRITFLRYNRTDATAEELSIAKEISKKVSSKHGTPKHEDIIKLSDQIEFGSRNKVTDRANVIEQELIDEQEENLKELANARGIGFLSNKTPYVSMGDDTKSLLMGMAKEEGENFVVGTLANQALVVSAAATGGAAAVIGFGVDFTISATREEAAKLSEGEEKRKEAYVQENQGDVLMLSRTAKKRIRTEALARASVEDQEARARVEQPGMIAGSPEWLSRKQKLDASINTLKWVLRVLDFLFAVLTIVLVMLAVIVAIVGLILLAVVSFAVSNVDAPDSGAGTDDSKGSTGDTVKAPPKKDTDKKPAAGSTAVPEGIDPASWETADEWGKKIASAAMASSIMTIDTPGTASNGGHLVYQQGDTPIGVYDCTVFVLGVLQSLGKLTSGEDTAGKYDFNVNKKSDLEEYMNTDGLNALYAGKAAYNIGDLEVGNWEEVIKPGDMLLLSGHVGFYVGKNLAGIHLMAHAGAPSAVTYYDAAMAIQGSQVGLQPIINMTSQMGATKIIRTSVDFK